MTALSTITFELCRPEFWPCGWWSVNKFPQFQKNNDYPYLFLCREKMGEIFGIPDNIKKIEISLHSHYYSTRLSVCLSYDMEGCLEDCYLIVNGEKINVCYDIVNWVKSAMPEEDTPTVYAGVEIGG